MLTDDFKRDLADIRNGVIINLLTHARIAHHAYQKDLATRIFTVRTFEMTNARIIPYIGVDKLVDHLNALATEHGMEKVRAFSSLAVILNHLIPSLVRDMSEAIL